MLNKNKILKFLMVIFILNFLTFKCAHATLQATLFKTPHNITVILLNDPSTDLISVNMAFKGAGSKTDPQGQEGLSYTSLQMLYRSPSDGIDRNERSRKIKELGVIDGINVDMSQDNLLIQFKCPEENLLKIMNIVSGIIINSQLKDNELNKLKTFTNDIQLETTSEISFAKHALESKIFINHPYGLPPNGLANSIQTLGLQNIKDTIKNNLAKNNLIVSIVGNIDQKKAGQYVDQTFSKLPAKASLSSIQKTTPKLDGTLQTIIKNSPQSGVVFALKAPAFNTADFYPMLVLNRIFGGTPFTSRLWIEVREKRGLAYEVGSYLFNGELSDILLGYFKCDNKNSGQLIDLIKTEFKKLQTKGVTEQEIVNAKSGLIGESALRFITTEQTSERLLTSYLLGGTIQDLNEFNQRINAVTIEQINNVIQKYININELTMVLVGNP